MADMVRSQLIQAYNWIKAGKKQQAEDLLITVLKTQPENADAWWLLANAVTDTQDQREALNEVLKLRPGDEKARKMLTRLAPPPPAPEDDDDPFADLLEDTPAPIGSATSDRSASPTKDAFDNDPFDVEADVDDDPFAEIDSKPKRRPDDSQVKAKRQEKTHWNPWALTAIGCIGLLLLLCGGVYVAVNQFGLQVSGLVGNMMDEIVTDPTFVAAMADPTLAAAMQNGGFGFGASDNLPNDLHARGSIRPGESMRANVDTFVSDSWTFQGNPGQRYVVEVTAMDETLDPKVAVYDHDNRLIAENDDIDFADNTNSRVEFSVSESTTYTIVVSAFGAGGSYELRVR